MQEENPETAREGVIVLDTDGGVRTLLSIGKAIEAWCKQNKVKQVELGDALGLSDSRIRDIERGKRELSSKEIAVLSYLMNKPYEFFIPNDNDIEDNLYLKNLGNRNLTPAEKMQRDIKRKCSPNDESERRLSAAMEQIRNVKDVDKKAKMIQHVENMLELAGLTNGNKNI